MTFCAPFLLNTHRCTHSCTLSILNNVYNMCELFYNCAMTSESEIKVLIGRYLTLLICINLFIHPGVNVDELPGVVFLGRLFVC